MMEVEWLEEALLDVKEIGQFIAADDPQAAYRVLGKIETTAHSLERHPQLGRPGRVQTTRELVIPNLPFIIAYYIKRNKIRILAVMHTSRKWPNEFSNLQ
ncbi:MAG: type II toxin-antitoxin system RelE/ParE family toxin [Nitrospirales bacterium]|nr:type II toxin-antitoxin system RelE/ParE family toxin [Nitrospirales bacterium]